MSVRVSMASRLVGGVLLIVPPLAWQQSLPPAAAGDPTSAAAVDLPTAAPQAALPTDPAPSRHAARPAPETTATEPGVPIRVQAASIELDAPLDAVSLEEDGSMELPEDVRRVGWYEPGVRPGEAGSAVLAGHVDSRTQGAGALFDLRRLEPGDELATVDRDGWTWTWEVTARSTHAREQLPIDELFRWEGPRQLRIITCGGTFDAERGSYSHNVVIHAVPSGAPQAPSAATDPDRRER